MAISTLSRLSVPLASDASASSQGLLMPKLKYRFRVNLIGFGAGFENSELTKQVMSFTRPNLSFEEITLPIYNSTMKLAGKHTWADATCEIRDDASGAVARLVGGQLQKQMDFIEMASAAAGNDYKFLTKVQILDGGNGTAAPVVLETWELYGCYLKAADYGSLNYGESAPVTISMTIAYDNANQVPEGTSVFTTVGSQLGRTAENAGGSATGVGQDQ
jgi:hypothetical protein